MPSLSEPQPGSTTAVGNASEGLYESFWGYTLIDGDGKLARKDLMDWTWGSITVTGSNWSFDAGTKAVGSAFGPQAVTGSGTFSPKVSMDGSYSKGSGSPSAWGPLTYRKENALAVNQESVAGKWSSDGSDGFGIAIEVDAAGTFKGTTSGSEIGVCSISGTLLHAVPQSSKNMYSIHIEATNAASGSDKACELDATSPYKGPAAIFLSPAGRYVGNGYFRTLILHALSAQKVMSLKLDKQR